MCAEVASEFAEGKVPVHTPRPSQVIRAYRVRERFQTPELLCFSSNHDLCYQLCIKAQAVDPAGMTGAAAGGSSEVVTDESTGLKKVQLKSSSVSRVY